MRTANIFVSSMRTLQLIFYVQKLLLSSLIYVILSFKTWTFSFPSILSNLVYYCYCYPCFTFYSSTVISFFQSPCSSHCSHAGSHIHTSPNNNISISQYLYCYAINAIQSLFLSDIVFKPVMLIFIVWRSLCESHLTLDTRILFAASLPCPCSYSWLAKDLNAVSPVHLLSLGDPLIFL